ncbi:MAG TPA: DUF6114 domain-containing protein [Microbacterium sp.]|uniref:DUF6114 domain-containing protein n=1 Tax=Microbacterium sp. TaxID=51671 RepID=UPI002B49D5B7|nr:DUF6114 domain-containing protein [Microbacterium sp.]HKT56119.1 DUF6114 domain-containing protein [Microbacterium sp.]
MLLNGPHRRPDAAPTSGFGAWYRSRPFVGGVLTMLAGVEIFLSSQLDLGNIHVQLGIEGFQATVIPVALLLLGLLAILMPAHHVFYGVIALVVAVYSLVGVNLGGFVLGMLLGCVGGILVVAWMPRAARAQAAGLDAGADDEDADGADAAEDAPAPAVLRRARSDGADTTDAAA